MQAIKGNQWCEQHKLTVTYIPHKGAPDICEGEVLSAATNQHALPASAEHDIHPPLIVQETKAP